MYITRVNSPGISDRFSTLSLVPFDVSQDLSLVPQQWRLRCASASLVRHAMKTPYAMQKKSLRDKYDAKHHVQHPGVVFKLLFPPRIWLALIIQRGIPGVSRITIMMPSPYGTRQNQPFG